MKTQEVRQHKLQRDDSPTPSYCSDFFHWKLQITADRAGNDHFKLLLPKLEEKSLKQEDDSDQEELECVRGVKI